nr:15 kDa selenoprotein [Hymenolepis microstoma]
MVAKAPLLLRRFPQVKAFVEKIKDYSNIRFIPKQGHAPTAILLNEEDGEPQESFAIDSWDTDTIEEFFRERLI